MAFANAQTKHNGHEYVDLGLSVKWATCNVGASTPEEYGGYYAWGETEEKNIYDRLRYKLSTIGYYNMTKYCTDSEYGTVDNKKTLSATDDVASVKWGGNWRMPTRAEQRELLTKCKWIRTFKDGVTGYKVIGPNGNSIFLPHAGFKNENGLNRANSLGFYWSSSLSESDTREAYYLSLWQGGDEDWYERYRGQSVRAVCP